MKRQTAYISMPLIVEIGGEYGVGSYYSRLAYLSGYSPICPITFVPFYLDVENDHEVEDYKGIASGLLRRADLMILCGDASDAYVKQDIAIAGEAGIPIITLSDVQAQIQQECEDNA